MMAAGPYVRRETAISVSINVVLSLAFFLLVFGRRDPIPVWGMGQYVFDFLPQSFMIALMSSVVPGLLAMKRRRSGLVAQASAATWLPRRLLTRGLLVGLMAALLGTGLVALVFSALDAEVIALSTALGLKLLYGGGLAAIVTPPTLRAALAAA